MYGKRVGQLIGCLIEKERAPEDLEFLGSKTPDFALPLVGMNRDLMSMR